jgi:hypothetical protein
MQIEDERENLCHYNRQLDDVTWWTRDNLLVAPDQVAGIIAPDIAADGWEVQENTSNTTHGLQGDISADGGSTYCFSVWAYTDSVSGRCNYIGLDLGDGGFFNNTFTTWDQTTRTLINEGSDVVRSDVEDWGGGWSRYWITGESNAVATSTCQIHLTNAFGNASYTGTSRTAVWFHPQIEIGDAPSSPIISTSSDVTRNKDEFYWPSAVVPAVLRDEFTFQWVPSAGSDYPNDRALFDFKDSGSSIRVYLIYKANTDKFNLNIDGMGYLSDAVTFDPHQIITITVKPSDGTYTLSGLTSGNGLVTATPYTTTEGIVRWGMLTVSSTQCNGLISQPY